MITIRGNAARAYGHNVPVEGRNPIRLVVCKAVPAMIPKAWTDHALTRITASAGDVVEAGGRHWQVSQANLDPDGKVTYLFKVDLKEGGERILHEISIPQDEATLFACDPEGEPTIGDVVEMPDPNRPKKPLRAIARNSSNACASQVFMPNGTIAYAPDRKAAQRATPETLAEAQALCAGRRPRR